MSFSNNNVAAVSGAGTGDGGVSCNNNDQGKEEELYPEINAIFKTILLPQGMQVHPFKVSLFS